MAGRLSNSARPAADAARTHDAPAPRPVLEAVRALDGARAELTLGGVAGATELVLRGDEERRVALTPDANRAATAATAVIELGRPALRAWHGAWTLLAATPSGPVTLDASPAVRSAPSPVVRDEATAGQLRVDAATGETALVVRPLPDLRDVALGADGTLRLAGGLALAADAPATAPARLLLRRRAPRADLIGDAVVEGDAFTAAMPLEGLASAGDRREVWDAFLEVEGIPGTLRIGARLDPEAQRDGVHAQRRVRGPAGERLVRPFLTRDDNLSVRAEPFDPEAQPAVAPAKTLEFSEIRGKRLVRLARRGALAALSRLPPPRRRAAQAPAKARVSILLTHAYGTGGTIRTDVDAGRAPRAPPRRRDHQPPAPSRARRTSPSAAGRRPSPRSTTAGLGRRGRSRAGCSSGSRACSSTPTTSRSPPARCGPTCCCRAPAVARPRRARHDAPRPSTSWPPASPRPAWRTSGRST